MGRLLYSAICSLDGYVADREGGFAWAEPDEEVLAATVELDGPVGTHLYGRRTYELMAAWEGEEPETWSEQSAAFARSWRALDKVVYSTSLQRVGTPRTRLERRFDPDAVRELVRASPADVSVGGPTLGAAALRAGLVDELHLFLVPALVGGGLAALPDGVRLDLRLLEARRFAGGTVLLRYAVEGAQAPVSMS
ncbi:dihydrofolate reductase family protein [Vallicoccus soli]|uniref:Deaminase n=1 Tax=Vallicoccus soli TaxID=2339232 RepID=A0A3A3Z0D3_9ACTN|nr:dihydrofolate reductase family protein [Vallicoccus soli]RJK94912.1 deaminase [Vallicoccus soli]